MSRIPPKWKVEKAKVKVVFRLQFHASHIPQSGWDKLFLSFIPLDTGKPTAKTNKASVKNGNCKWSDPIYETTRLLQDPRTKKYDDKLYKLVVAMGSSRSCLLGDVSINLADFADASKPSSVALPLHSCDFGTILHVTVQLLTSKTGFREFEQQRELSVKGFQPLPGQRIHNPGEIATVSSPMGNEQMDKVNAKVRFKEESPELHSFEKVGKSNEDYDDLAAGIDGSSNTSESLHAEKNDFSSANEVDSLRSTISGDAGVLLISQSPRTDRRLSTQGSNEWTHGWSSDYSADNDLAPAYEENNRLRARLEVVESAFLQLKTEAKSLQSLTSELGVETQSLAEQLVLELASGEKLTKEVSLLKSECYKFKSDLEELRSATAMHCVPGRASSLVMTECHPADTLSMDGNNFPHILQTKWLQDVLFIEEKVKEIQNKACLAYHGSGVDFLLSDLKFLDSHLQNLKQGLTTGTSLALVEGSQLKAIQLPRVVLSEQFNHGQWLEGSYNPDAMIQSLGYTQEHKKNADAAGVAEETMCELLQKLEESKTENINLAKKMGQMECYYEAFIQELEDNRQQAVNELENLRTEHSSCLYTISALQSQVEKLGQDMNEQFIRFAADRHDLDSLNKELEKKAVVSESALKRVRWNYAVAVDRLQKDLELLSFQVLSMYETNENLAKQALADVSQIFCPEDSEVSEEPYRSGIRRIQSESISTKTDRGMSQIDNGVSDKAGYKDLYSSDFIDEGKSVLQRGLHNNIELQTKDNRTYLGVDVEDTGYTDSQNNNQRSVDTVGPEDMTSPHILKELKSNTKAELPEIHMLSIHWELFAQVLQETLRDVNDGVKNMKHKMVELTQQLEDSSAEKESVMLKWHNTLEEARVLRKDEIKIRSEYDDLMMRNHILEAELRDVSDKNTSLAQKIAEYMVECQVHESKYESCLVEKNQFEEMLKSESLQKSCLETEICSTVEGFKALQEEFNKQSSAHSDLQNTTYKLQEKLRTLYSSMVSCNEEIHGSTVHVMSSEENLESDNDMALLSHLEDFQHEVHKKILQLRKEKQEIEGKNDVAICSLNEAKSQILDMEQNFESEMGEITRKLGLANALVGKLNLELEDVTEKLKFSLEAEERSTLKNKELLSKLTILEVEIQQVSDENRDLAQKLLLCNSVSEELENTKSSLMDCMQENRDLMVSIESAKVASIQMEDEVSQLKECLRCAHDEMQLERRLRKELEATVQDLTLQLTEKVQQLLFSDEQKTELVLLRKRVLDLEKELHYLLLSTKESQRKQSDETSSLHLQVSELENELAGTLDYSLNTDVKVAYMRNQFKFTIHALVDQNKALQGDLEELNLKHVDMVTSVESHMVREARLLAENARLSTDFQSLKAECELVSHEKEGLIAQINEEGGVWADLENELEGTLQNALNTDVKVAYMKSQFQFLIQALVDQNNALHGDLEELNQKHVDIVTSLEAHMVGKARLLAENARFSEAFQSLKAECELISHEKEGLIAQINEKTAVWADIEDLKARYSVAEACHSQEKLKFEDEACCLRNMVVSLEEEVDSLRSSRDELETTVVILTSKLDEQRNQMSLFENCNRELKKLREQYNELTFKLSEQTLKTEEFKNLSTHLRELKDKADAECLQARQRREADGSSLATQESLRIALIKEQCESKLEEVKSQLCASKRYAEEMLLKLQNALDEVESRKKNEAVLLKRNEEFSMTISNMESELRTNIADRRELVKDCDRMKAELECTTLSLDCCKEEKLKLEVHLQECIEERTRTRVELDLVKRLLENLASSSSDSEAQKISELGHQDTTSIGELLEDHSSQSSAHKLQQACNNRTSHLSLQPKLLDLQDGLLARHTTEEGTLMGTEAEQFADISENFKERQRLMTGMDLLHKELERLKNDNLSPVLPLEGHYIDPTLQYLESELLQLDKANDQLESISPLFKELPGSGNALQRVLAMEVELAEALQLKKPSEVLMQSSFLKQHNDEEAVFRSFKDINELIRQMLESRRRYAAVEAELTEMQGRYTQLSLKFAEVEGERQQLAMTLKTRTPKKPETPRSRSLE